MLNAITRENAIPFQTGRLDEEMKRTGYLRKWASGIRGVRVSHSKSR